MSLTYDWPHFVDVLLTRDEESSARMLRNSAYTELATAQRCRVCERRVVPRDAADRETGEHHYDVHFKRNPGLTTAHVLRWVRPEDGAIVYLQVAGVKRPADVQMPWVARATQAEDGGPPDVADGATASGSPVGPPLSVVPEDPVIPTGTFSVTFGSGTDFDRLLINGVAEGPHLSGPPGEPGAGGADGHSPSLAWGSGADADRISIDGALTGPHLTGPRGPAGGGGGTGGGALVFDVTQPPYNAVAGGPDCTDAIQAAIDDAGAQAARLSFATAIVKIPSAPQSYVVSRPVHLDWPNVELVGEGKGSTLTGPGDPAGDILLMGVPRVMGGRSVDSSYRPDLFGKLDATAVPEPGKRRGYRTNGDTGFQGQAIPAALGPGSKASALYSDNWSTTDGLCLEAKFEPHPGTTFPLRTKILGLGYNVQDQADPGPFLLQTWVDPDVWLFGFKTSDQGKGRGWPCRWVTFSVAGVTPPYDFAADVELSGLNPGVRVFLNRRQVAFLQTGNMDADSPSPFRGGVTFATNDHYPFFLGGGSGLTLSYGGPTGMDLCVYGVRMSTRPHYQDNGPGSPQLRADTGQSPDDLYSYLSSDATTICYLDGLTDPETGGRTLTWTHGPTCQPGRSFGLILHTHAPWPLNFGNAVRNLQINGGPAYGTAVAVGGCFNPEIERVRATGAGRAIGSVNSVSTYRVYLDHCELQGFDSPLYCAISLVTATNISFVESGRCTIRLVGASLDLDTFDVSGASPTSQHLLKARDYNYGGRVSITRGDIDYENGQTYSDSAIVCEAYVNSSPCTELKVHRVDFGGIAFDQAVIELDDTYPLETGQPAEADIRDVTAFTTLMGSAVKINGPRWKGEAHNVLSQGGNLIEHTQKFGPRAGIVIHDTRHTGTPRWGSWYPGATRLDVRSPADGQFTRWECTAAGRYGTGTKPLWFGMHPITANPMGLATYMDTRGHVAPVALN